MSKTSELEQIRREAIMVTVNMLQSVGDLFMAVHNHAHDCAVTAQRMAALVYGMKEQAEAEANPHPAPRADCSYKHRLCDCGAMDCPAACDCETCPDKEACEC